MLAIINFLKNYKMMYLVLTMFIFSLILSKCENKKTIKIGFSGCLTGKLSDLGISGRNGFLFAIEEINRQGGIKGNLIEPIIKDDKHDKAVAVQVTKELIDHGVVAIVGHMTSTMTIEAVPIINDKKIVMVSPTTSTNKLTGIDDYFFRVVPPNKDETDHLAKHCYKEMGISNVAFLYDLSNKVYSEGWYQNFKSEFEKLGGKVTLSLTYESKNKPQYFSLAQELVQRNTDGILVVGGGLDTAMICQQLKKLGFTKPIIAAGWAMTSDLIQHGGTAVDGLLFSLIFNSESKVKEYVAFRKQFKDRFGKNPDFAAVYGYESAQILINSLLKTDSQHDLKTSILNQKLFKGLQGNITINRYGDAVRKRYLITVKDRKFIALE